MSTHKAHRNAARARMVVTAERYTRARRKTVVATEIPERTRAKRVIGTLHRATGLSIPACGRIYRAGAATDLRPVPDASQTDLRHLEAKVFYALSRPFRDTVGAMGFILGVEAVEPWPDSITIVPHERLWHRVMNELLPSYEPESGNLYGVAGLRFHSEEDDHVSLVDLETDRVLKVARPPDGTGISALRLTRASGRTLLWRCFPDSVHPAEAHDWDLYPYRRKAQSTADRDLLLSRLLRRVAIINRTATTHGCINLYDHSRMDAVFEWCCGPSVTAFLNELGQTGFCERVERDPEREEHEDAWARALIGQDRVLMRRASCYILPDYYRYRRTGTWTTTR